MVEPISLPSDSSELPPALLAVFAHPDDEAYGTSGALLDLAAHGVAIHILCLTPGDAGEISDPALATPETLGEVRKGELREACRLLGIAPPVVQNYPDGGLATTDEAELIRVVVSEIRRVRPQTVLTFDANGGYGHPDHIVAHRVTVAAFALAADPAFAPEAGEPHQPKRLYATAYARSVFPVLNAALVAHGFPALDFGSVQTIAAAEIGTPDDLITTAVPVSHHWEQRWAALLAHRTQYGESHPFVQLPKETMHSLMAVDRFRRMVPPPAPDVTLPDETRLWVGIGLPGES